MAKPTWVHVPGPKGRDTTVQLLPDWLAAVRVAAGSGWNLGDTKALVQLAAGELLRDGYAAVRDGAFSTAVRRRAYKLALRVAPSP